MFTAQGLDASLEEIAQYAQASIGTLYNHFPTREAMFDATFPERIAAIDQLAAAALTHDDAREGLAFYLDGMFEALAADRGLRHVMTRQYPEATLLTEACHRGFANTAAILARAGDSQSLRDDFTTQDFACLVWAMARIIDATAEMTPDAWFAQISRLHNGRPAPRRHTRSTSPQ